MMNLLILKLKGSIKLSECTHNCSTCSSNCASKEKESLLFKLHEKSKIKHVIGVASGKGGVGKSTVTSLLAVAMARKGYKVAILDADITGPSIPKNFGLSGMLTGDEDGLIVPAKTRMGIDVVSANLMLEDEETPIIWRGPVVAGAIKQFWEEACWNEVDYMFVDMPPGTGDVPLTVFQSLPIDGAIIVTTPQDLVSMVVSKCVNMAEKMKVDVLGIVENMSYIVCPDCGKKISVFGQPEKPSVADSHLLATLAKLPIDPKVTYLADNGRIEEALTDGLDEAVSLIEKLKK